RHHFRLLPCSESLTSRPDRGITLRMRRSSMRNCKGCVTIAVLLAIFWGTSLAPAISQQAKKIDVLRIGTTGVLLESSPEGSEETAQESFRNFIKNEVGFNNEILAVDDYKILSDRLQSGKLHLGVFMGYEF